MNNRIRKEIINRKAGTFVHIVYESDMTGKLSAASRKAGYHVTKITSVVSRTGCNYSHITDVIIKKNEGELSKPIKNPYTWVVPNKIKKHNETGEEYIVLAPLKNCKATHKYIISNGTNVIVKEHLSDEDWQLFQPSARPPRDHELPDVISVKLSSIREFNHIS